MALQFFFHIILSRPGFGDRMARVPTPERLPLVLSPAEVALLLAHAPNLKYRAALSVAYGCGLRISEIARHYGLLAGATRAATIARIRGLLGAVPPSDGGPREAEASPPVSPCPCCGGLMIVIEILSRLVISRPSADPSFKVDPS